MIVGKHRKHRKHPLSLLENLGVIIIYRINGVFPVFGVFFKGEMFPL